MKIKREKVYYAHSKQIYDTKRERDELQFLCKSFDVLCPNIDIGDYNDMSPYLNAVKSCDRVICSEYKNHIGKGVYEELLCAFFNDKKVDVLRKRNKSFTLKKVLDAKCVDCDDWRVRYAKLKCAKI